MKKLIIIFLGIIALQSCSSKEFKKSPIDQLIIQMNDIKPYSIILQDMDVKGSFSHTYLHKYKIITEDLSGVPQEKVTDWMEVPEQIFSLNENNLGMEIVSKNDEGKVSKTAAPPGYGNYVGNSKYGEWRSDNSGNSFWSFYGKYMMMSTMFDMMRRPYYRNDYNHYRSGGYYGSRSYYGPKSSNGSYKYGTNSSYTKQTRKSFFERKSSKRGWSSSSRRTSNSSTRSRSSSSRSRSGGFGK
ncbi:MAG: hypothetical protein KAH10_03260 [Flavobacteriales bacterium]|nr:hypothetical protein [Flavobacteriales bacterium]